MSDKDKHQVRGGIERSMFALWLQDRENELLRLVVHRLENLGWKVMALVFDGVLVEHNPEPEAGSLSDALRNVEEWLKDHSTYDWDVTLTEKNLYGRQAERVRTVEEADAVAAAVLRVALPSSA